MILPLWALRKLTISRTQKLSLLLTFSLGAIIVSVALVRLVQVSKATSGVAQDPTTVANEPILLTMWSHMESTVAVIVAIPPFFRFFINKSRSNSSKGSNKYQRPTIGGSHIPSKSRNGQNRSANLNGGESEGSRSQTELRPIRGFKRILLLE